MGFSQSNLSLNDLWRYSVEVISEQTLVQGTEILFALGLGSRVIAVTDMCSVPPEVVQPFIISRCRIDSASFTSVEMEQKLVALKAEVRKDQSF